MKMKGGKAGPMHILPEIAVTVIPSDKVKKQIDEMNKKAKKKNGKPTKAPKSARQPSNGKAKAKPTKPKSPRKKGPSA
jgi:hypothetical protein